MIPEEEIRETFYNVLMEVALTDDNLTVANLQNREIIGGLIMKVLTFICKSSGDIKTYKNNIVTSNNVPPIYVNLFSALQELKLMFAANDLYNAQNYMKHVVGQIQQQGTFDPLIKIFIKFYTECHNETAYNSASKNNPIVDTNTIRDTFYNLMVEQVLTDNLIDKEDLESVEPYIFFALSSLVIIASICYAHDTTGIRLYNGAIVNENNCPDEFKPLCVALIKLKKHFNNMKLNDDQIRLIKICSLQKNDSNVPTNLVKYQTNDLMKLVSMIVAIATDISKIPHFKSIIVKVIEFCIAAYN